MNSKRIFAILIILMGFGVLVSIKNTNAMAVNSTVFIDYPQEKVYKNKKFVISGWLLSNEKNKAIKLYIDDTEITVTNFFERNDVLKLITGYGTIEENPTPGFSVEYDASLLSSGKHIVKIDMINSITGELLTETTKQFEVASYKSTIFIDAPSSKEKRKTNMNIRGWALSEKLNKSIEVYMDGVKVEGVNYSTRDDVLRAIVGYGTIEENPTPGFSVNFDNTKLPSGEHTVKILLIDNDTKEELASSSKKIQITDYNSTLFIDAPSPKEKRNRNMSISGWALSDCINKSVETYIDGNKVEGVSYTARDDVLKVITGYGTIEENPTPGFSVNFDNTTLTTGKHIAKVILKNTDTNEELSTATKEFEVDNYKSTIFIDQPTGKQAKNTNMSISGWALSDCANKNVEIYVDGAKIEGVNYTPRNDVLAIITGFGSMIENPTPGFRATFDNTTLTSGKHVVKVILRNTNTNEELSTSSKEFEVDGYKSTIFIDQPTGKQDKNGNMIISGWALSDCTNKNIEIYVDENKVEGVNYTPRNDVLAIITGFGSMLENPTPGFSATFDNTTLTAGKHLIRVVMTKSDGSTLSESVKEFTVNGYKGAIFIDTPKENDITKKSVDISGWALSSAENKTIEVYVDEQKIDNISTYARNDVLAIITGFGTMVENPTPGFRTSVDTSNFTDGNHTVKVLIRDNKTNDIITTSNRIFKERKYDGTIFLDSPASSNFSKSINISGWEMSELDNSYIRVFVDNVDTNAVVNRSAREDVLNIITTFGGRETNSTPGFSATVDISNISSGMHTLYIKLYSKLNDEIAVCSKSVMIYNNVSFGIDVSKYQQNINWGTVRNEGISFAFVRAGYRGYGTGAIVEDNYFRSNVNNAAANNIKVGTYFFSQAINEGEAVEEADFVINKITNYGISANIKLPIVIDTEYSGAANHEGRADGLSKQQRTNVIRAFVDRVRQRGYEPMIYASKSFLYSNLDMNQLSEVKVWLAHYTSTTDPLNNQSDYKGLYQVWQYSSKGTVNGISGYVDMNISYEQY